MITFITIQLFQFMFAVAISGEILQLIQGISFVELSVELFVICGFIFIIFIDRG